MPTIEFIIDSTPTLSWMLSHRQPIHILDTNDFEGWVPLPQSAWIRAFVGAPIMESGAVIGFLTLNSGQPGTFQAHDAERLQAFANHASIAIRNARLFDTAQRYTAELERRVNERTAELNMERNQLQAILESTGEGIVYTASDRIQYVNQALVRLTGYEAESLIGQPITALDPSGALAEKWQSILTRIRRGILTWRDEVRVTRRDNSIFDAGLTVSLSGHPADEVLHTVTVVRDISQEKALEDQKSRFIATASHELRTPITNLRTRLYLVQHQPERMRDHLQVMNDVVLRMQGLVEDLLDQSRFERGMIRLELDRILLQELIANVVRTQYAEADSRNISLTLDLVHQPQYILGDAGRLEQVLTNLLTNSLYYTPERGSVQVRLEANEDTATISVCDTGVGIAPEHLDHVFEAFVRANDQFKGTGLGLSIAKQIIDMHGGEIRVESEPGRGSCFYVTLKRLDEVE